MENGGSDPRIIFHQEVVGHLGEKKNRRLAIVGVGHAFLEFLHVGMDFAGIDEVEVILLDVIGFRFDLRGAMTPQNEKEFKLVVNVFLAVLNLIHEKLYMLQLFITNKLNIQVIHDNIFGYAR